MNQRLKPDVGGLSAFASRIIKGTEAVRVEDFQRRGIHPDEVRARVRAASKPMRVTLDSPFGRVETMGRFIDDPHPERAAENSDIVDAMMGTFAAQDHPLDGRARAPSFKQKCRSCGRVDVNVCYPETRYVHVSAVADDKCTRIAPKPDDIITTGEEAP